MALADTVRLIASLDLKGNFNAQLRSSEKALGGFETKLDRTQSRAYRAGQQIGTGIKAGAAIAAGAVGFLAINVAKGLQSLEELESQEAQTNAVLKSTKSVAGETAKSIRDLAEKYEGLNATIDDKVIQSGENLLLTFTNIRKEAFEPALKAALDMNQAMGGGEAGLQGTIQKLGKALNDPIKGLQALGRVGITFTKQQKDQIKSAVEAGDTFKAQGIILAELNKRFGGSFLAGGDTTRGKVAKFKDAIEDLQKALATALLPTVGKVSDAVSKFLADPKVVRAVSDLGEKIASLFSDENLAAGGRFLSDMFETAKAAAPIIEGTAKATLEIVKAAVGLFKSLPGPIQGLAVGAFAVNKLTGGLVTNILGGIADLVGKSRGASPANPVWVASAEGGIGGAVAGGGRGLLGKAASIVTKVAIVGMAAEVASLIAGPIQDVGKDIHTAVFGDKGDPLSDFGKAWEDWRRNADWPFGQKNAPEWLGGNPSKPLPVNVVSGTLMDRGGRFDGPAPLAGKAKDDFASLAYLATLQKSATSVLRDGFRRMTASLRQAKTDKQIKLALSEADRQIFIKGIGGSGGAKNVLRELKSALGRTHDPQLQRALRAEISKVEKKIVGRQLVERQLKKADQIYRSSESTKHKIEDLKTIERQLKDRGVPNAANKVREKIDALKRSQLYAQQATTQAIKDKDLSVQVNNTIPVSVNLSARTLQSAIARYSRYYKVPT